MPYWPTEPLNSSGLDFSAGATGLERLSQGYESHLCSLAMGMICHFPPRSSLARTALVQAGFSTRDSTMKFSQRDRAPRFLLFSSPRHRSDHHSLLRLTETVHEEK